MARILLLIILVFGLILIGVAALLTVAIKLWGPWGVPAAVAVFIVAGFGVKKAAGWALQRVFMIPFKAKGAVLRGASVQVHSITPAEAPARSGVSMLSDGADDDASGDDEDWARDLRWYQVDLTITPKNPTGPFGLWEPSEMVLSPPDAKAMDLDGCEEEAGTVADVKVWRNGRFGRDDPGKYPGEQRLSLHVGVKPGTHRAKLRYYFELLGDLEFPSEMSNV